MSSDIICSSFFNYILNLMISYHVMYHMIIVTYLFIVQKEKKKSNQEKLK